MKIAFLNIYNGIVERGSEIFVKEIAGWLSNNHTVHVYQSGPSGTEKYHVIEIKGSDSIFHQSYRSSSFNYNKQLFLFTVKSLLRMSSEKYDWIVPVNGRIEAVLIRLFRYMHGGKILISGHAGIGADDRINLVFGKPDVFVALSKSAADWARKIHKNMRIDYIPNGVDTDLFNPKMGNKTVSLKNPYIITVSALIPDKRIDLLVRAVSRLGNVGLLVIGDGPLREEIRRLGVQLLGNRFLLIPSVNHTDLPVYYRDADIFSLPSKSSEAFGIVYLEAMACNLPVVAPDDENRRQLIGSAGLFCRPEEIELYADTLQQALKMNFGKKPRNQAEKYSWRKAAEKYEKIFNEY